MGILSKPFFVAIFATLSAHCAYRAWMGYSIAQSDGGFSPSQLRLRILEASGGPGAAAAAPTAFGLLRGGCQVARTTCGSAGDGSGTEHGAVACVIDGAGASVDGYFFEVGVRDAGGVPTRWVVEASDGGDRAGLWRIVGSSTWRLLPSGRAEYFPELPAGRLNVKRSGNSSVATVTGDLRPPPGWVLLNVILFVTNSVTTFACWASACLRRSHAFRFSFYSIYITAWGVLTCAAFGFDWPCMWREAVSTWLRAAVRAVSTCCMVVSDGWLIPIFISLGTVDVAISLFTEAFLYRRAALGFSTVGLASFQMLFGLLMLAFRSQAVAQAHSIVRQDRQKYDALWASVCAAPGADAALRRLEVAAALLAGSCKLAVPRQLNHNSIPEHSKSGFSTAFWRVVRAGSWSQARTRAPIDCLDQLYAQVRI